MTPLELRALPSGFVHLVDAPDLAAANVITGGRWGTAARCSKTQWAGPAWGWTDDYPPECRRCPKCFPMEVVS